jgi:brefeldin A-resistance guanine nucleotide exchange factor 1
MRICQRLLPYKEDTADMLLGSLSLVGEMHPAVVWELAPSISADLITLLSQSAPHIRTETGWRTIMILIRISASREEVLPYSLQALQLACQNPSAISTESYIPLLETCLQLIDGFKATNPGLAAEFLECADALFAWLPSQDPLIAQADAAGAPKAPSSEALFDLWLTSVGILTKGLCRETSEKLRHASLEALHRTLIGSSSLHLPPDMWVQTLRELVLPLVSDYAKAVASRKKSLPEAIKSLEMAIDMLTNVLVKYTPAISGDNDFGALWESTLDVLKECAEASNNKATRELVLERTRTLLSTLVKDGTLSPAWKDGSNRDLWDLTWKGAAQIPMLGADAIRSSVDTTSLITHTPEAPPQQAQDVPQTTTDGSTPEDDPRTSSQTREDQEAPDAETHADQPPGCQQS